MLVCRDTAVADRNEFALIDWLRQRTLVRSSRLEVGIGDDAAVWRTNGERLLFTTDLLMDGVDFRTSEVAAQLIGRKAMAVNLSDIAAMAGRPLAALMGLVLPRSLGFDFANELLKGCEALANEFDVAIIGGDTNIWDGPLVISVTVMGEATERGPVLRSTAKPGDWIFVTGPLGGSILGHQFHFMPRVREAMQLHELFALTSMIDLSDGLAADLHHILDESCVGATLDESKIPITEAATLMNDGRLPLEHAFCDGEDFELLFTVNPSTGRQLAAGETSIPVFHIGEIEASSGVRLRTIDGSSRPIERAGWEHRF